MLERYLADGPYEFSMAFSRGTFAEFWGPSADAPEILSERRHWLQADEAKYLQVVPDTAELLDEAHELAFEHKTVPSVARGLSPREKTRFLGEQWEPDFLILKRSSDAVRLVCGCVCFPSSWALEEKIGLGITEIHDVVPALNSTLGRQIEKFLEKMKPGVSWLRSNWGLSRSPERNQHPSRKVARLDATVRLNEVFFRVEEQSLVALPKTGGILFGIRLRIFSLGGYARTKAGLNLVHALQTMPEAMAHYKGVASARAHIISLLKGGGDN